MKNLIIGTAHWSIPKLHRAHFIDNSSQLTSYASRLRGVEINSSFYKEHLPKTYEKWYTQTPEHFRFSLKLLKEFTHYDRLHIKQDSKLPSVLNSMLGLKEKFKVLLIQLPPYLPYQKMAVQNFFSFLRQHYSGHIVLEPRHRSWASEEVWEHLVQFQVNKVFADPEPCPIVSQQLYPTLCYMRLHGSPVIYESNYSPDQISAYLEKIMALSNTQSEAWCIFDNTKFGAATTNALWMEQLRQDQYGQK